MKRLPPRSTRMDPLVPCTRLFQSVLVKLVWSGRRLWTLLLTGGAAAKLREELLRICLEIAANRTSPHASAPPADVATLLAVSGTIELLSWWLRQSRPLPIADVVDIHTKLVLLPIIEAQQAAIRRSEEHTSELQ